MASLAPTADEDARLDRKLAELAKRPVRARPVKRAAIPMADLWSDRPMWRAQYTELTRVGRL